MRQAIENTIESTVVRAITTWSILGVSILAIIFYAFFVNKAIFQAVEAKNLSAESSEIASRLNSLQERFLSLQNSATLSKAGGLGLAETENQRFISRKTLGKGLSLRDEI